VKNSLCRIEKVTLSDPVKDQPEVLW